MRALGPDARTPGGKYPSPLPSPSTLLPPNSPFASRMGVGAAAAATAGASPIGSGSLSLAGSDGTNSPVPATGAPGVPAGRILPPAGGFASSPRPLDEERMHQSPLAAALGVRPENSASSSALSTAPSSASAANETFSAGVRSGSESSGATNDTTTASIVGPAGVASSGQHRARFGTGPCTDSASSFSSGTTTATGGSSSRGGSGSMIGETIMSNRDGRLVLTPATALSAAPPGQGEHGGRTEEGQGERINMFAAAPPGSMSENTHGAAQDGERPQQPDAAAHQFHAPGSQNESPKDETPQRPSSTPTGGGGAGGGEAAPSEPKLRIDPSTTGALIVVSNRLPVTIKRDPDVEGGYTFSGSSGGLVSALGGCKKQMSFNWIGWPGLSVATREEEEYIERRLREEYSCTPVWISDEIADRHYNGFSNSILWPLFHYHPGEMNFNEVNWLAYREANLMFAEKVRSVVKEGDMVWVQVSVGSAAFSCREFWSQKDGRCSRAFVPFACSLSASRSSAENPPPPPPPM